MNKRELISVVASRTGLPQIIVKECLYSIMGVMLEKLKEGEKISMNNFGSFYLRHYGEKNMFDPRNGESMKIEPKSIIKFKISPNQIIKSSKKK